MGSFLRGMGGGGWWAGMEAMCWASGEAGWKQRKIQG